MGLLNQEERQKLIDLLCQLPGIDTYPHMRSWLVATLPEDLRNAIVYVNAAKYDVANIVDMVSGDTWCQLPDDSYPVLIVIVNAINMVRGSRLAGKLHKLMNILRDKFGLPPMETLVPKFTQSLPDQFMQRLYDLITLLPILKTKLDGIRGIFGRYLLKQKCQAANARLINLCTPVREFTIILERSEDLKVKNNRSSLRSSLYAFNNQTKIVEDSIGWFSAEYGIVEEEKQPVEERKKIQEELGILIKDCEPVLEAAEILYSLLSAYYASKQ